MIADREVKRSSMCCFLEGRRREEQRKGEREWGVGSRRQEEYIKRWIRL